jgi:hypothetical protein
MEEWPSSNGNFPLACMWICPCEFLGPLRLMGRGNIDGLLRINGTNSVEKSILPTPTVSNLILNQLYPDLPWANNNTENCVPDCLPATWRMDMARAILIKTENKVSIVPVFWQLYAKGSQSGRATGDCTHKSLDAVLLLNEQVARSMMKKITTNQ